MHKLFDLATPWEYLPLERRNLIEIVKIKNVTRRTKEALVLSSDQFREVVRRLPAYVNMIANKMSCLGLRVSEALGLKWEDFDWQHATVTIRRSAYRGATDETKTTSSKAKLPTGIAAGGITAGLEGAIEFPLAVRKSCDGDAVHVAEPATEMDSASGRGDRN